MREFFKLVVALSALVFVSATVARSIAFADDPLPRAQAVQVQAVLAEEGADASISLADANSVALALASIACVGFMAGRRRRRL